MWDETCQWKLCLWNTDAKEVLIESDFGRIVSGRIFINTIGTGYPRWGNTLMQNTASSAIYGSRVSRNGPITAKGLLRCDLILFRNAPAKAAYCPFCLGDKPLNPPKRMEHFLDRPAWFAHVGSHLSWQALDGRFHCRHPACALQLDSLTELEYHLKDVRCYAAPRGKKRG
ncbi:conserved hypothetical protein [Aspergillus lentulus]|nr:conserved hypothetical protein [Aspergillus lentulus]